MPGDEGALLALAAAVLDRQPLETVAEADASGRARDLMAQFQAVAELAALSRAIANDPAIGAPRRLEVPLASGTAWGPLTIVEPIGAGSFGDVYRAIDTRLDRAVALKLLRRHERAESVIVDEARLMARVHHPNVVAVYGAERIDGRVGIWMQLVEGRSLEDELIERGAIPPEEVVRLGIDLCRALDAIHRAGLVHRDLKAQNVLRDHEGRVLVSDFGAGTEVGRHDEQRTLAGTPLYLAPEILDGAPASVASDTYALGVLLFHLLTLAYPVIGRSMSDIRAAHSEGRCRPLSSLRPGVSSGLAAVIGRAMQPVPGSRFATTSEMEAALNALERPAPRSFVARRAPRAAAAIASVTIVLAGGFLGPRIWQTAATADEDVLALTPRKIRLPDLLKIGQPSPDMRVIPYIGRGDRAQIWDLVLGRSLSLTREADDATDETLVVAPDGRQVAVATFLHDDTWELRLLDTGADVRRPLIARQNAFEPIPTDWSSSGREVLCYLRQQNGTTDLALVPVDGGPLRIVHSFSGIEPVSAKLSLDGRFVAATVGVPTALQRTELVVLDVDRGAPRVLADRVAAGSSPAWTMDGSRVFYLLESDTPGSNDGWEVPVRNGQPVGQPTLVAPNLGNVLWARPVGAGLVARLVRSISTEVYTRTIDLTGARAAGSPQRIATDEIGNHAAPAWAPDGRLLAYIKTGRLDLSAANSSNTLIVVDTVAGVRHEVSTTLATVGHLSAFWFPDGRSLMVWGSDQNRSDRNGFYRVGLSSGRVDALVLGSEIFADSAGLSRNGRVLYYRRAGKPIMARDLASGQEREVVSTDRDWVYAFRVAPDGSLAYARRRKDSDAPPVLIVQSPSGVERELIRGEDTYEYMEVRAWSPDGTRILYTHAKGQQPNGLYLIPREGGRPLDLGVTFPRARFAWPVGFSLHPNGRVLAYPEVVMESELWLTPVSKAEPESSARLPE